MLSSVLRGKKSNSNQHSVERLKISSVCTYLALCACFMHFFFFRGQVKGFADKIALNEHMRIPAAISHCLITF